MTSGIGRIGFIEMLFSEITMVVVALAFILCGVLLIFKHKTLGKSQKWIVFIALIVTGCYILFVGYLAYMWGRPPALR